ALAARLLLMGGKSWRAASLIEDAWTAAPHPALALAYRDLKADESAPARAKRLRGLAELNPHHRESRILTAEQALALADGPAAEAALAPVVDSNDEPSARLCGLLAQVAQANGRAEEARAWVREAALAPGEPDWSDLDPEGPAFAYTNEDWARLVFTFGDTGQLIHPRHERYERHRLTAPNELLLEGPDEAGPTQKAEAGGQSAPPRAPAAAPPQPDDPGVNGRKAG
ncbi:MAG: heme biosynthesis protein HemY, partial [Caulobacterales bacterium]|nr:heme biosynthesis protein HemY [Caulobacterales bacterium]